MGGNSQGTVWGTTVSIEDSFYAFNDFLRNFSKKYQMYRDGLSEQEVRDSPDANSKPYLEALETMLMLGTAKLYLDMGDLKLYPPTRKLWHQLIMYPQEIVPVMDQAVKDAILELANKTGASQRASQSQSTAGHSQPGPSQSSEPVFPSSDRPDPTPSSRAMAESLEEQIEKTTYFVRPYGMENTTNLRELNPSGM